MKKMSKICLVLFLLGLFVHDGYSEADEENTIKKPILEGQRCVLKKTGEPGLCTNVDHCDYAKNLLKMKDWKRPQHCSTYIGIFPVVCCPAPRSEVACQLYHPPEDACLQPNIFGGVKTLIKEFPHMAALGFGNKPNVKWFCGGSLISEQFILTAAHCISTSDYGTVKYVSLGDTDLDSTKDDDNFQSQPQHFTVVQTFVYPEYKPPAHYHDIALIKLDRPARFNKYIKPACLHTEVIPPHEMTISGYGKVALTGNTSSHLLKANLFYVNHTTCSARYSNVQKRRLPRGILSESQVCAGHPEGKDTCPGDSGGPLQYRLYENPHYRIVGVTSFGQGCGVANSVAVYTRVAYYRKWIEDIVWPANEFSFDNML